MCTGGGNRDCVALAICMTVSRCNYFDGQTASAVYSLVDTRFVLEWVTCFREETIGIKGRRVKTFYFAASASLAPLPHFTLP